MSWDYANLSHLAKEAGGPDLLISSIEASAKGQGRIEGAGIGALIAGAAIGVGALIYKAYGDYRAKGAAAKAELAAAMASYDQSAAIGHTVEDVTDDSGRETPEDTDEDQTEQES